MMEILSTLWENRIQLYVISGCLILILLILKLIQKSMLKVEYALLWFFSLSALIIISIFKPALEWLAFLAGIFYAPAALLLLLILGMLLILIHYSVVISKLAEKNKITIQEIALLHNQINLLKAKFNDLYSENKEIVEE